MPLIFSIFFSFVGTFFIGLSAHAQTVTKPPTLSPPALSPKLFFPVERNNIQVLPQRFEYQLLDKDRLQVGDIPVNSDEIDFQLIPLTPKKNDFKIRFRWPLALFGQGELVLKDNSGKAIWSQSIKKNQLKKTGARGQTRNSRADLAIYDTTEGVTEILKALKMYPFFKFCIQRSEPRMRLTLCSKDLYLKETKKRGGYLMATRDSLRPESFVEINGRRVDNQGLIFLNSPEEFLSLRGLLLSGASLELETRLKPVEFKDVVLSDDGSKLIVRAEGAEPVNQDLVKKRGPNSWEAELDSDRPTTYLKGEGDIPFRQEFLIKGPVRKESVQVYLKDSIETKTYDSHVSVELSPTPEVQLLNLEKNSELKKEGKNYRWTLSSLKNNNENRRYLKVKTPEGEFVAGYDFPKAPARDGQVRLMLPLWAQLQMTWNIDSRWSASLGYDQQMVKSESESNFRYWTGAAQYRLSPGIHSKDPTYLAELFLTSFETSVASSYLMGPGFLAELQSPSWYASIFQWTHVRARLPLYSSQADYKLKQGLDLDVELRHYVHESNYWLAGARYQSYKFESDDGDLKLSKAYLFAGLGWLF